MSKITLQQLSRSMACSTIAAIAPSLGRYPRTRWRLRTISVASISVPSGIADACIEAIGYDAANDFPSATIARLPSRDRLPDREGRSCGHGGHSMIGQALKGSIKPVPSRVSV